MRVIAGSARGRPLQAPKLETRPTSDKVKGAIFSMLEAEAMRRGLEPLEQDDEVIFAAAQAWPEWLDLYAGSGALGIEALSRGARLAEFVERDVGARGIIAKNLERTGLAARGRVLTIRVERLFAAPERRYDAVLADPPYAEVEPREVLERLDAARLLNPGGAVILEHARAREAPEQVGSLRRLRSRTHGLTSVSLYESTAEA
jgi:16S rRNA (guanine966-N2)-methyltransferase